MKTTAMSARPLGHQEHGMLIGQLALVLAPQTRTLPVSVSLLLILLLGWRWLLWRQHAPLPSKPMVGLTAVLVLVIAAALIWQSGGSLGRELCVALLAAFVILKLMETRALTDATLVTQLSFYLLLTLYLADQPFWLAIYSMVIGAWILRNWLLFHHPEARGRLAIWPLLGRMALFGLPWALLLFVLFPRLDHPLWRLPQAEPTGRTGITDTLKPGSVGDLIRSPEVAFRADIIGAPLPASSLYWRALVLWDYDGQAWRPALPQPMPLAEALREDVADDAPSATAKAGLREYNVTLEPTQKTWLYLLDRGTAVSGSLSAQVSADGEFFARTPVDRPLRYRAQSSLSGAPQPLTRRTLQLSLTLPEGNPRSRELAAQWAAQYPDPWQRVQAAMRLFAAAPFAYTLSPPPLGKQQVDSFLFDTRRGFCEHYASSFVFLMRAAGVPARVVVGYQGGEFNPVGRHYVIRQSDAHAWSEVWIDGRGWVRVDPTSAVAPSRVEEGVDAALAGEDLSALRELRAPGWLRDLRWGFDGLAYKWQRWVLEYDRSQQTRLLDQIGFGNQLPSVLAAGLSVLGLLALAPMWLRRRHVDPVQALYDRFCALLARHDCVRMASEGPRDFGARAARALPRAAAAVRLFTDCYVASRYGAPGSLAEGVIVRDLRAALRDLSASLRR
ncbi:transglutaminaseTgpA domain-containing protein [Cupriavidus pauculus]|jgi:transglutaminase-like putative cysteine protease|uniref:transglutaminase family protein n=1 Tax=Cupriavidus pauculus TaxID=82633 RepID=UPI0030F56341